MSIPRKVYGRVLAERLIAYTEGVLGEEQSGFRRGRGCIDKVFMIKNVCEKYMEKWKSLCIAFLDLEKAYERVARDAMW